MQRLALVSALTLAITSTALAADMTRVGDVMIHNPWARASIGNAPNSAAYMTLETMGAAPDRLVGASTSSARAAQLHDHTMANGVAKMRPVEAIEVAPGETVVLGPGGPHLMLMGLTETLAAGSTLPLTLVFEHAGEVTLEVRVEGMAYSGKSEGATQHGGHGSQ